MWDIALRRRNTTTLPAPQIVPPTGKFEGNDGKWSTFWLNIGDGQLFRTLVSTSFTVTTLPHSTGCNGSAPTDCPSRRGIERFNGAGSTGYQSTGGQSTLLGLETVQLGQHHLDDIYGNDYSNISGMYFKDIVGLGNQPTAPTTLQLIEVIGAIPTTKLFMGLFGLGRGANNFDNKPLLDFLSILPNITDSPIPAIPSLSYGYTAGASYYTENYFGSLVLGGYDAARFTPPKYYYTINPTTPLEVGVQSILVNTKTNAYSATLDTSDNSQNFVARIDSTLPYLWFPKAVCDRFETIFGLTYDTTTDHYIVNDTMRQRNIDNDAKVMIKFADTVTSPNASTITLPYAAFDLQASWPIYNTETNYFPLRRAPDGIHVLGRTFLQEAYLTVDYERNNFSVAQATFSAQGPASVIVPIYRPAFVTQAPNKKGLSTGAIAGIGAAGGVIGLLLILLAFFLWRRNKKRAEAGRLAKDAEEEKNKTEVFPDLNTPLSEDERRRRGYSGSTALSSELDNTDRRLSELPSPDSRISGEYFGHKKTVSKETNVSELEVVHEIHELPAGIEGFMSRGTSQNLVPIREGVDEALGVVEVLPTPSPVAGVSPMNGRSPGASPLVQNPNEEIESLTGRR